MIPAAVASAIAVAALSHAPAAQAADPGRWIVTTRSTVANNYRQGLGSDKSGNLFFSGPFAGIYRTRNLRQTAANANPIPADVTQREQYNHIGDITWDASDGGRLLLPLESYKPFTQDTNPSKTGSIGVMDPATLRWLYYVKLDPNEIAKTQWVAAGAGGVVWTVSSHDLLAYRLADVSPANAAPTAAPIHSVRRIPGVVPTGAGGAAEIGGRLYMSTFDAGVDRVFSVDLATGATRVEYEHAFGLEPEGVDAGAYRGGILHFELVTGLANPQLLDMLPKGAPLRVRLAHSRVRAGRPATVKVSVVVATSGYRVPLKGVQVRVARSRAKTDASGRATLRVTLTRGSYRVLAFYSGLRSATTRLRAIS